MSNQSKKLGCNERADTDFVRELISFRLVYIREKPGRDLIIRSDLISQPFPMITNDDRCQDQIAQQVTIIHNRQRSVGAMLSKHVKMIINQSEKTPSLSP